MSVNSSELRRHMDDPFAHGPARTDLHALESRVNSIERFQQRLLGGVVATAAITAAFGATLLTLALRGGHL